MSDNPYASPTAATLDAPRGDVTGPIWNPNAAIWWSLLFSPMFGTILHMKNWQALGKPEKAAQSKTWLIVNLLLFVAITAAELVFPALGEHFFSKFSGLLLLIVWYVGNARDQVQYVEYHLGPHYARRGWGQPLLYALLVVGILFAVIFAISFGMAALEEAA